MFDRFTDRARVVMSEARNETSRLESSCLGTEHLLLGMIMEGGGVAAQALRNQTGEGIDPAVIVRLAQSITVGAPPRTDTDTLLPFTPRCKGALDKAKFEAERLRHGYIGTEHLLLGLLLEEESVAAQILGTLGHAPETIRAEVMRLIGPELAAARSGGPGGPRVAASPERLGLSIEVSADAGGTIAGIKKEFAVLANRLGITVHGKLNDELCLACPGEDVARVYMKKKPQPCQHESRAANTDGDLQCRSCGLVIEPENVAPLLNPDQVAVMRHAIQAGLRSVPVFARAFDLTFGEIEKIMAEITPEPEPEPKPEWETVYDGGPGIGDTLERFPVPRGWIFRSTQWSERDNDDPGPLERTESMTTVQA